MSNWVLRVVRRSVMASLWLMKMLEAIFVGEGDVLGDKLGGLKI